jgi:asparaginyl-tRNA synthetase
MIDDFHVGKIAEYIDKEVTVKGWIYNRTHKGKLVFLLVRDGYGFVQCVGWKDDFDAETFEMMTHIPQESSVVIEGRVRADPRAPGIPGGFEVGMSNFQVVQSADTEYPMALKEHGVDFALDNRHFWLRFPSQWAILKVRAAVIRIMREWLDSNGFINLDTPILTPSAAEGTTTLFETEYFDEGLAFLAQTGQLYNEANIYAFKKVYCFGPTFRAEKSKTRRHLTEFWMLEPEIAFCDLDGLMDIQEQFIVHVIQEVLNQCENELLELKRDLGPLREVQPPFPRLSYDEALKIINELQTTAEDPEEAALLEMDWGMDFGSPHETALMERFKKPVFIYGFPTQIKAFYMEPWPDRPEISKSVDLLAPQGYGEITGGSERISDPELLLKRIMEHNLPEEAYRWYIDLRKFGSVPHSGFGLGLERTVSWICGISHVRETIPFPRTINRIYP